MTIQLLYLTDYPLTRVDGYIIMSREYFIDWTCDYELVFYPFDTQVCQTLGQMCII